MTTLNINGVARAVNVDEDTPLLWALRQDLGLTGTKFGCGMGLCGACMVQIDGVATRSCVMPAALLEGRRITTIEGANDAAAEAVKAAWVELDVAQCGYCQPGQVMAASALLRTTPRPTDGDIEQAMTGNICRCGTYPRIRAAIHLAASKLAGGAIKPGKR